jgi:acyl-CoA synthetase (AMP-forming)/AMP-acid ligase II
VQLPSFDPAEWVRLVREQEVTHAMVVPTMLARIVDALDDREALRSLRHLSYGGDRMPLPVLERALALLPHTSFVNAYVLTETSSSISVLDADEHRTALASGEPAARARLASVGRPLPTVEITIRDGSGVEVPAGEAGEIWVRGDQVSGEYTGMRATDEAGWFMTNDAGRFDADGYLYVEGRLDDVIVRGGENIAPGEIEDVLLAHDAIREVAVLGVPDEEWGEAIVAVVVTHEKATVTGDELRSWVTSRLRSSRSLSRVEFRAELPYNDTGKPFAPRPARVARSLGSPGVRFKRKGLTDGPTYPDRGADGRSAAERHRASARSTQVSLSPARSRRWATRASTRPSCSSAPTGSRPTGYWGKRPAVASTR